jgi:hypothetical protein
MTEVSASWKTLLSAALISALSAPSLSQSLAAKIDTHKVQISIDRSYVKISLTVDLKLNRLAELFKNCFAEGKAWAIQKNSDATAEWRDNPNAFRDLQWFYDRDYELRSVVDRYISVVRGDEWFDSGAHPNQHIDTILWNDVTRKRVSIRPFFIETADNGPTMTTLARLAKLAVATAKLAKGINGYGDDDGPAPDQMTPEQELQRDSFISDGIKPAILEIGPVTLVPSTETGKSSGLTFHYSPYGVGPYVEGPYTVFVRWTAFRQYLSPNGMAVFGGERPKSDEENW